MPICDEVSSIFNCLGARTSAGALRQLMGSMCPKFEYIKNGQQQGAPEFLEDLLETIEIELKDSGNSQKSNRFRELFEGHEIIQYNFIGARSRDGECPTCRTPPDYAEKKFNILVLYNDNHSNYSLQQMIDRNLLTPSNVFEKYCANGNCKDAVAKFLRPAQSRRMISDLPNILFIMVPKFTRKGYSNDVNMHDGFVTVQEVEFEVVGILDHVGNSNTNGHWFTWAKIDSKWYECNDDIISEVKQTSTISSNNYLFVCTKVEGSSAPKTHDIAFIEGDQLSSTLVDENNIETTIPETSEEFENALEEFENPLEEFEKPTEKIENQTIKITCKGCQKEFSNLIQHLSKVKKTECKKYYNLEQMRNEAKSMTIEKKRKKRKIHMEEKIRNMSDTEKKFEKEAATKRKRRSRSKKSDDEKKFEKEANAKAKRRGRSKKSGEEKKLERKTAAEGMRKLRESKLKENKDYKKTLAEKQAMYRQKKYSKINSTVSGRKRIFLETVRDGPIYGCICCHRTLFKNAVIEIENIERFRENLNEAFDDLFEYSICSENVGEQLDLKTMPSTKGKFYLCTTCKSKLVNGQRPAQSHQNNLEIFDAKNHPELNLTELESSLISKALVFMKIFKKPKSRMAAIKDRCVCVPIDDQTVNETLKQLPRTPAEACIVPIKLKRKKEYKGTHLKEYVDVEKLHKALEMLKNSGHPEYQFYEPSDFQSYARRCEEEDPDGFKTLFEDDSEDEFEETDQENNDEIIANEENVVCEEKIEGKDKSESEDEFEEFEKKEEHYLKVDAVAKEQFEYNRNIAFSNDFPELQVQIQNEPIDLAPGEGKEI